MSDSLIDSIEALLPALREACNRYEVALAYLYGSQARGQTGPLSDVDIAILFQSEAPKPQRVERLPHFTSEAMRIFKRPDVFVVDLADATPLLRYQVYHDGSLLFCMDEPLRVKFMVEALRDYEDTRPLRELQRHYLYQSIDAGTFGRPRRKSSGEGAARGQR